MTVRPMFTGLIMSIALVATGCTADVDDQEVNDDLFSTTLDPMGGYHDPTDLPPGSTNDLAPSCWANQHMINGLKLAGQKPLYRDFTAGDYNLYPNPEFDQLSPECHMQALKYIGRCAVPKDTFFLDPQTGEKVPGWLGIAPRWLTEPLSTDDQWWITSCLTQHLNAFNFEVPILASAIHPDLYPPEKGHPEFTYLDSHTWGNVFSLTDRPLFYACYDKNLGEHCYASSALNKRLCDNNQGLGCNLIIMGPCDQACTWSATMGAYSCGASGFRNIGSRLKDDRMYEGMTCR